MRFSVPAVVGILGVEMVDVIPGSEMRDLIFQGVIVLVTVILLVREKYQFKKNCDRCLYFRHYFIDKKNSERAKRDQKQKSL